jgi:hypothetical protein
LQVNEFLEQSAVTDALWSSSLAIKACPINDKIHENVLSV